MDPETKKTIEAQLTKEFLNHEKNNKIVAHLIHIFVERLRANLPPGYQFYLKGGNAVALLEGKEPTGDYDFQLVPPSAGYANWSPEIDRLTDIIISSFRECLGALPDKFDETVFDVETLRRWTQESGNPMQGIDLSGIEKKERNRYMVGLGAEYGRWTYWNIRKSPKFSGGRFHITENEVARELMKPECGPVIYVNYIIPEFILYRVIYEYIYVDNSGREIYLKSEIIDVTVPRSGSAESHQGGKITYLRTSSLGVDIPGWGYHFYENVNMLQEIELGISASAHKAKKRRERGLRAMEELIKLNPEGLWSPLIQEPGEGGKTECILGYLGALTYHVNDYSDCLNGQSLLLPDLVKPLEAEILQEEIRRSDIMRRINNSNEFPTELDRFVKFRITKSVELLPVLAPGMIRSAVFKNLLSKYNPKDRNLKMTLNNTFRYITPMMKADKLMPVDFVAAAVIDKVYDEFLKYIKNSQANGFCVYETAFFYKLTVESYTFYMVYQKCGETLPSENEHIEQFLEKSILMSQRVPYLSSL